MRRWFWILRHRTWAEVRETWPVFLFFAGPLFAWVLAVVAGRLLQRGAADQIRYFGTWLQLFGLVLVAQGVRELRRDFDRPTMLAWVRARGAAIVQSFKPRHHTMVVGTGNYTLRPATLVAFGRVGGTFEQRLDNLAREIDALRAQAEERERKLDGQFSEVRAELAEEKQERIEAHADVTRKLDNVAVGGLHLDVVGLWWLLFATIATSVPDGVAWIGRIAFAYLP